MTHLSTIKPLQCFSGPYGEEVLVLKVADSKGVLTVTYQASGNLHHLDVASFSATMSHQGPLIEEPPFHEDVEAEGCVLVESVCEEVRGSGPFGVEFSEHLKVPIEVRDLVRGLFKTDELERGLLRPCARFVHGTKYGHSQVIKSAEAAIKAVIRCQKAKGRRDASRIARKMIKNLQSEKPSKPQQGQPISSSNLIRVVVAIYELKLALGGKYPDRNAVFKKVNEITDCDESLMIPRSNLGKMIRKLGLDEHIGGKRNCSKGRGKTEKCC